MQLFKRVLLSLFPDDIVGQSVNPASMFISFISTKDFFSVINRKIVENYKLNLFDVTMDPFEFKIWFGESHIKTKDIDTYYGYSATANLNGYRFFSPANVSNALSLVSALYVKDIFRKYPPEYYLHFLYSVYLLSFVFLSRIKIFPYKEKELNYNRCVDLFFAFYDFVFQQTGKKPDPKLMSAIKKDILHQTEIFFLLLPVYQECNRLFVHAGVSDKDMYAWLFYDELKEDDLMSAYKDFIDSYPKRTKTTGFSVIETRLLHTILPADILLKYLFLDADMFLITETVVAKLFDKKILDGYLAQFRKDEAWIADFLFYITDYRHFKKNFFSGVQKYIITLFRNEEHGLPQEDLDDVMSSIGDDIENIEWFAIPERIKKESKLMEKILNFYITFVGGFWISRGDSFFLRLCKSDLITDVLGSLPLQDEKNYTLTFYGSLLYQYGKNVFYYKYTADNVRAGKQKFVLPKKPTSKNIYSNISLLKSFDENFLAILLQDINPKDIRIYLKHKKLLDLFRWLLWQQISDLVTSKPLDFLQSVYGSIAQHLVDIPDIIRVFHKYFTPQDLFHIKENVYNMDFWIAQAFFQELHGRKIRLSDNYSDTAILGIFSFVRETLFGFVLYLTYLQTQETKAKKIHKDLLMKIYIRHVLFLDDYYDEKITKIIEDVMDTFQEILIQWISLDDNQDYLRIAFDNRLQFTSGKADLYKKCAGEDYLWFTWFLKNITYYNKRFIIPK